MCFVKGVPKLVLAPPHPETVPDVVPKSLPLIHLVTCIWAWLFSFGASISSSKMRRLLQVDKKGPAQIREPRTGLSAYGPCH